MPTDVIMVRTSGQGKATVFWFQLRTNFLGSNQFIFDGKQFKMCSMLVEKAYQMSFTQRRL